MPNWAVKVSLSKPYDVSKNFVSWPTQKGALFLQRSRVLHDPILYDGVIGCLQPFGISSHFSGYPALNALESRALPSPIFPTSAVANDNLNVLTSASFAKNGAPGTNATPCS